MIRILYRHMYWLLFHFTLLYCIVFYLYRNTFRHFLVKRLIDWSEQFPTQKPDLEPLYLQFYYSLDDISYKCTKLQFIRALTANAVTNTSKTAKIVKKWYYPPSHRLTVNALLNNVTFYDFCCFWCVSHCIQPLTRACINCSFVHLYLEPRNGSCRSALIRQRRHGNEVHQMKQQNNNNTVFSPVRLLFSRTCWTCV